MHRQQAGCVTVFLAIAVAGIVVWVLERVWPYLLLTVAVTVIVVAARAALRHPEPVPLDAAKAKGRWAQATRMTDAERDQVERALRDAAADGRLDVDELEERLTSAHRARRWRDVRPLVEDLGL
jgi:hypothetical protein